MAEDHTSAVAATPVRLPPLTFGEAATGVFRRWLDFSGRSRRSEYWWFTLVVGPAVLIGYAIGTAALVAVGLAFALPCLSLAVRRMHDMGRSGAWVFWLLFAPQLVQLFGALVLSGGSLGAGLGLIGMGSLLALAGTAVWIILCVLPGDPQPNQYGLSPAHEAGRGARP